MDLCPYCKTLRLSVDRLGRDCDCGHLAEMTSYHATLFEAMYGPVATSTTPIYLHTAVPVPVEEV